MRLIDGNALYEKTAEWEAQALHMVESTMHDEDMAEWKRWSTILTERSAFKFDVADAPTIDAVPVSHGRWEIHAYGIDGEDVYCSVCGNGLNLPDWNYCPNCGARMDVPDTDVGEMDGDAE